MTDDLMARSSADPPEVHALAGAYALDALDPFERRGYEAHLRECEPCRREVAELQATAARLGAYRAAHRLSAAQRQVRQQLVVRDGLIQTRTRAIAMSGALVRGEGLRIRSGKAEHFQRRLDELTLPPALAAVLAPTRTLLTTLHEEIAAADDAIAAIATGDPVVTRLMTVPGVGPVTAVAFVATLDRVDRFAGAHQVESYLGLVPSEDSSADRHHRGGITKAGNPRMRWLLVQAAWAVLHATRAEARPLRAWAERIAQRRGKRVATVALARRLAGILFALWRDETTFDVTRLGRATRRVA